jgi:hypothetical protein
MTKGEILDNMAKRSIPEDLQDLAKKVHRLLHPARRHDLIDVDTARLIQGFFDTRAVLSLQRSWVEMRGRMSPKERELEDIKDQMLLFSFLQAL